MVGWSYDNTRLYCRLRGWSFRDTQLVTLGYTQGLRAVRDAEVWIIGPEWKFHTNDLTDIYDVLQAQGLTYRYGETDWLLK